MSDKVDEIVSRAINYTLQLLIETPELWPICKAGLIKIRDNLASFAPAHPALKRLERFIAEQDDIFNDGSGAG